MNTTSKKILGSIGLVVAGAILLYSFLVIRTWHGKAVVLDCLGAAKDATSQQACIR